MDWIDQLSEDWQREYPRLDVAALPPLVRLARLSILIEAFQREVLEPFELASGDYSVLAALRRAGRPYALNPSQLAGRLQRSSGGMTKMLKRLEQCGYIERSPDPEDGRGSVVSLTRSGLAVQDRVFHAFLIASQALLSPVSAARLRDADDGLRHLLDAFEAHFAGCGR